MRTIEFKGKFFKVDRDGHLVDGLDDFNPLWVEYSIIQEGLFEDLGKERDEIGKILREYFVTFGNAPRYYSLPECIKIPMDTIWKLFPTRGPNGACAMFGLPKLLIN